jgi:hypothetical protein
VALTQVVVHRWRRSGKRLRSCGTLEATIRALKTEQPLAQQPSTFEEGAMTLGRGTMLAIAALIFWIVVLHFSNKGEVDYIAGRLKPDQDYRLLQPNLTPAEQEEVNQKLKYLDEQYRQSGQGKGR